MLCNRADYWNGEVRDASTEDPIEGYTASGSEKSCGLKISSFTNGDNGEWKVTVRDAESSFYTGTFHILTAAEVSSFNTLSN